MTSHRSRKERCCLGRVGEAMRLCDRANNRLSCTSRPIGLLSRTHLRVRCLEQLNTSCFRKLCAQNVAKFHPKSAWTKFTRGALVEHAPSRARNTKEKAWKLTCASLGRLPPLEKWSDHSQRSKTDVRRKPTFRRRGTASGTARYRPAIER